MMRKIVFHGELEKFGKTFSIDTSTPGDAIRLIAKQIKGLEDFIRNGTFKIRGENNENGTIITEQTIHWIDNKHETIHVEPAIVGNKRGGFWQTVAGIAIVGVALGAAFATGGGSLALGLSTTFAGVSLSTVALFGASLAIGGIASMLSPVPTLETPPDTPSEKQSFLFEGPVNSYAQGNAIPLIYGIFGVGSIVISTGVSTDNIYG